LINGLIEIKRLEDLRSRVKRLAQHYAASRPDITQLRVARADFELLARASPAALVGAGIGEHQGRFYILEAARRFELVSST
jgi:hypothetical protein